MSADTRPNHGVYDIDAQDNRVNITKELIQIAMEQPDEVIEAAKFGMQKSENRLLLAMISIYAAQNTVMLGEDTREYYYLGAATAYRYFEKISEDTRTLLPVITEADFEQAKDIELEKMINRRRIEEYGSADEIHSHHEAMLLEELEFIDKPLLDATFWFMNAAENHTISEEKAESFRRGVTLVNYFFKDASYLPS